MQGQFSGPGGRGRFAHALALTSLVAVVLLAGCSDGIDKPESPPVVPPQPRPRRRT